MSVWKRFDRFLKNLNLTDLQLANGRHAKESVVSALNAHYYGWSSGTANSRYIGSWGKRTRIRPPRDVDVRFLLPETVRNRFAQRVGNRQSQLLQEVRAVLGQKFHQTAVRGDGPVVVVPFSTLVVEVVPAFYRYPTGSYVCVTANGGYYKHEDYEAQDAHISLSNNLTNGNTRDLIKMIKCWQSFCSVPLRSFLIELSVIEFLSTWGNAGKPSVYYDWMVRDYFFHLTQSENRILYAPGTGEALNMGNAWSSKAESALRRAREACENEANEWPILAGEEWQKIFGQDIPKYV